MKKNSIPLALCSLLALLLTCGVAVAANTPQLQKIKHTVLSPASEQVVLQFNGSYSPKVFTLKGETPRVIFDFPDITHSREVKSVTATNGSIVKRVRVGMHTDDSPKTRVVLDLTTLKGVSYTQNFDEKNFSLVIQLTGPEKVAAQPPRKAEPAQKPIETGPETSEAAQPGATAQVDPNIPFHSPPQQIDQIKSSPEETPKEQSPGAQPPPEPVVEIAVTPKPDSPKSGTDATQTPQKVASEATAEKTSEKAAAPPTALPAEAKPEEDAETIPTEKTKPPPAAGEKRTAAVMEPSTATPATGEKMEEGEKARTAGVTQEESPPGTTVAPLATPKKEVTSADTKNKIETAKAAVPGKTADGPELEYIKFDASSPKGEMVMFKLNGFHPPTVHGVEEGIPRVICDFNNTKLTGSGKNLIKTDGKFVKVIRTSKTKKPEKVRVVIDLEPNRSYDLQQVFFKEDNLFVIIVNTMKK